MKNSVNDTIIQKINSQLNQVIVIPRHFERHGAYEMFQELKLIFQANARIGRYEVSNKFYNCKMEENSSVSEYIDKQSVTSLPLLD